MELMLLLSTMNDHANEITKTLEYLKQTNLYEISAKKTSDKSGSNSSVVSTLRPGYSYNEVKVYAFLRFARMVNISGAGIGVSE